MEYRGLLLVLIGSMFFNHVILGGGFPVAAHVSTALWPISTTLLVVGDWVIWGKPGGSLSTVTKKTVKAVGLSLRLTG
jgi:hypothetical protein